MQNSRFSWWYSSVFTAIKVTLKAMTQSKEKEQKLCYDWVLYKKHMQKREALLSTLMKEQGQRSVPTLKESCRGQSGLPMFIANLLNYCNALIPGVSEHSPESVMHNAAEVKSSKEVVLTLPPPPPRPCPGFPLQRFPSVSVTHSTFFCFNGNLL